MKIVLATNNKGKLIEIKSLLSQLNISIISPSELGIEYHVEETGKTFQANASLKSEHLFKLTNLPVIADDSGLCVTALDGDPGVDSALFGDPVWDDKKRAIHLLEKMKNFSDRSCYYHCTIAFTDFSGTIFFEEDCHGLIASEYDSEGRYGFGYDPIFFYPPMNSCFSRVPTEEKNNVSHRGLALKKFYEFAKLNLIQKT